MTSYPGITDQAIKDVFEFTRKSGAEVIRLKKQVDELQKKLKSADAMETPEPTPSGAAGVLKIDDFESDRPSFGGGWWEGGDQNDMGTTVIPDPYTRLKGGSPQSPGYCAGMKGHLGPNEEPWAWAALTLELEQNESPADLMAYRALRFYTQGDGKTHKVSIQKVSVKDYRDFQASFVSPKKWTQVTLILSEFKQSYGDQAEPKFDDVKSISFSPGLNDADYDFKIDDLELLK